MNATQRKKIAHSPRRASVKDSAETSPSSFFHHCLHAFGMSLLISPLLMLVCALIAYFSPDPGAMIPTLGVLCALLTAFVGGFLSVRRHKHSALLCGTLTSMLLLGLLLLLSLFFRGSPSSYSVGIAILLHIALPVSSIAGAYIALPRAKKARPKKKHR